MKIFFHNFIQSSTVRGGLNSSLPMLLSMYLFYFMLPEQIKELGQAESDALMLIITIVGLLNNNNLGLSQYTTWAVVNKCISYQNLLYLLLILVGFSFFAFWIMVANFDTSFLIFILMIPAVAVSTLIRAVFESFSDFFQSFFIKLLLNSVLCIVMAKFWNNDLVLFLLFFLLNIITFWFLKAAEKKIIKIKLPIEAQFDWSSYGSFFLMFMVGLFYFYFDRFYLAKFYPEEDFSSFVVSFEQIIKLALPLNLILVYIFPIIAKKEISFSECKNDIFVASLCWITYTIVASLAYLSFTSDDISYPLVVSSLLSVGIFLLLQRLIALRLRNFILVLVVIIIPNALSGLVILSTYVNIYDYIIMKSLLFAASVALAFYIQFHLERNFV